MVKQNNAYYYAIRLLACRAYSCHEIKYKLQRRNYTEQEIQAVIAKLEKQGYIDDKALCRHLVDDMLRKKRYSMAYIANYLYRRGFSTAMIQETLAAIPDQGEREYQAAATWLAKAGAAALTERQIAAALGRRGFRPSVIARVIEYFRRNYSST